MSNLTREDLISTIKADAAEDWQNVVDALKDGAYLESIGVTDDLAVQSEIGVFWMREKQSSGTGGSEKTAGEYSGK